MDITEIEYLLCDEAIQEICQSGSNDEAVKKWLMFYMNDLGQMNICPFACKKMLSDYDYPDYVEYNIQWMERALWVAAWNVFESTEIEA